MSLEELISTYGYAAIGIGTFLEGETILILGGFSAHRGYLALPWVIVCAFLGTLAGDQLYFYIGRAKGRGLLEQRPAWKSKSDKVFLLMENYDAWPVLGFRFLYGIRTVTPFLIGTGSISSFCFLILNMLGVSVWAGTVGTMGYLFGHALEAIVGNIKHYELLIIVMLIGAGVVSWLVHFAHKKRSRIWRSVPPEPAAYPAGIRLWWVRRQRSNDVIHAKYDVLPKWLGLIRQNWPDGGGEQCRCIGMPQLVAL